MGQYTAVEVIRGLVTVHGQFVTVRVVAYRLEN